MRRALAAALLATVLAASAAAQEATPTTAPSESSGPTPAPTPTPEPPATRLPWPTGDELRRELQLIRFDFRIDGDSGEWRGWPPRSSGSDQPALRLGRAGTRPAVIAVDFELLFGDPGPPLTALAEVISRLPLEPADVEDARQLLVEDVLELPPESLEPCYRSDWEVGALLITIDVEQAAAIVELAPSESDLGALTDAEPEADCGPLIPAEVVEELGETVSERVTVTLSGDPPMLEPAELALEGARVTLILTVRNDTASEQTITFEPPIEATTGPIAPGELKLIVVRELEPGDYAFASEADPDARVSVRISPPLQD